MRVVITTTQVPFIRGGAESLAEDLCSALAAAGHETDIVRIPFKWYPPEAILDHMLACRLLDLRASAGATIDRVIALKFPAYLIPHPNTVLWLVHQHHSAYERWGHPLENMHQYPLGPQVRAAIHHADRTALGALSTRFAISHTVAQRLARNCGLHADVLHPPPRSADRFYCDEAADYVFFPSRLTRLKRQTLVLDALAATQQPVRVVFAGVADEPGFAEHLRAHAVSVGVTERVQWLGSITDDEMRQRYAHAVAVVFPPTDEDYGLVAVEAMASSKPVLTCTDSGGPLELVTHTETGLIVEPHASALASAMDTLWRDRSLARAWGRAARMRFETMTIAWPAIVQRLLA